jgi:hypothetical protein
LRVERFPADEESGYGVMEAANLTGYAGVYHIEASDLVGDTRRIKTIDESQALKVVEILMEMFTQQKPLAWLSERIDREINPS